jgi:ligand-binding sensor domain-containing protein/signal transduction histidine kinase
MALAATSNDSGTHLRWDVSAAVAAPASAAALAGILLVWCASACALDASLDISQYAHTSWTFRNGFLNGAVYAISQAPDGYLWLGTQTGVFRFDGVRAVPLPLRSGQALTNTEVGALLPARDGTLWMGTLDGLVSWKNGEITDYPTIGPQRVNALLQDREGTVWVGTASSGSGGRLCAIRSSSTQCYGDDGSLGASVESLYEDPDGSLWVGTVKGLWRWKPGPPKQYFATPIVERQSLAQGDHGSGLVIAMDALRQFSGTQVTEYPLPGLPWSLNAVRVLRDRTGGLWIGSQTHGLVHSYEGSISTFTRSDGLSSDQIKVIFEDREGTLWVGTSAGLDRFHKLAVTSLSVEEGLSSPFANSVLAARDGSLWIGTASGLDRLRNGRVTAYRKRDQAQLPDDDTESLFEDDRGRIWVSGYHGLAVLENGKFRAVSSGPNSGKFGIAGDAEGGLWLSVWFSASEDDGLLHLVDGRIAERMPWKNLGGGPGTGGLAADPDGGVWVGLRSGGISYFHQGQSRNVALSDGNNAAAPKVLDLFRNPDGSFWIGTDRGLSRLANGRIATLTTANGLPCNQVHWIQADDASAYWLYTRCGLLRVARQELDRWIVDPQRTIPVTTFDAADGVRLVPALSGFRPQVTKSADGRIWFVNYDTVSFFDPSHIAINPLAPPVHIEQLTADRVPYPATPAVQLPARVRDVSIAYTALSLVAPEKMRFRYKLEGQDPEWREVINSREAHYSNLAPGAYRFRVIASNNHGVWNEQGASLAFSILPAYWQTLWFRALCGAALLGVLVLLYWLRVRQLALAFNMKLDARVDERTRIARELHDTMLQNFQGVLLQLRAALRFLEKEPARAGEVLTSAIDQAAQSIRGGREAVQGLRASAQESNDLPGAIVRLGTELAAAHSGTAAPSVQVEVEGTVCDLHPIIRDEVFRVAAEALHNVFQHSHATQVEVELWYDPREFRLRVRDDGQGIDPQILTVGGREGHFGLRGMRERAKLAGGKLTVWSAPDSGTEVELLIPGSAAYAASRSATE